MKKLLLICFCLLVSCDNKEIKFDQFKWNENFDGLYHERESMIHDLMNNHLKKGMTYAEIIKLIGEPENFPIYKKNAIGYTVMEDYGWDIDPVEHDRLIIEFTKDSLLLNLELKHWSRWLH